MSTWIVMSAYAPMEEEARAVLASEEQEVPMPAGTPYLGKWRLRGQQDNVHVFSDNLTGRELSGTETFVMTEASIIEQ